MFFVYIRCLILRVLQTYTHFSERKKSKTLTSVYNLLLHEAHVTYALAVVRVIHAEGNLFFKNTSKKK